MDHTPDHAPDHTAGKYNATPPPAPDVTWDMPEAAPDAARTERNLCALDELIAIDLDLVRLAHAAIREATDKVALPDLIDRCQRQVQATRRSIALSARIVRDRRVAAIQRHQQATVASAATLADRKKQLDHVMGIAVRSAPPEQAAGLPRRFNQRVDHWDIEQDLTHRSVDAAVTRLCTEFGIAPPPAASADPAPPPSALPPATPPPTTAAASPAVPIRQPGPAATARIERVLALHHPP